MFWDFLILFFFFSVRGLRKGSLGFELLGSVFWGLWVVLFWTLLLLFWQDSIPSAVVSEILLSPSVYIQMADFTVS